MNKKTCKKIIDNKNLFVPSIFTLRQFNVLKKYYLNKNLTKTEKTYLYTSIKKKIKALELFNEEYYINGKNMLPERIEKSKEILNNIKENAFISGSFLFKKNYNDIDIFIISKKRKQFSKGKFHYNFITEKDLDKPMIASAALYCISNFEMPIIKVERKRYGMENTLMAYQIALSEHIEKEGFKTLKNLIMEYNIVVKNKILDSYELHKKYQNISKSSDFIEKINQITKELLFFSYSNRYLYDEIVKFSKKFPQLIKEYKSNKNLIVTKRLLDEIKRECRKVQI